MPHRIAQVAAAALLGTTLFVGAGAGPASAQVPGTPAGVQGQDFGDVMVVGPPGVPGAGAVTAAPLELQPGAAVGFIGLGGPGCDPRPLDPSGARPALPNAGLSYTESTDRLAQSLGVSGDRLRQALEQSVPRPPAPLSIDDLANRIAQGLNVSADRVKQAFTPESGCGFVIPLDDALLPPAGVTLRGPDGNPLPPPGQGATERLNRIAQQLGVSPDRLRGVLRQVMPTPPADPPRIDDVINRLAQNLGVSPDRVRAAFTQTGPNGMQGFGIPVPGPAGGGTAGGFFIQFTGPARR
jgi:hypothetical protein